MPPILSWFSFNDPTDTDPDIRSGPLEAPLLRGTDQTTSNMQGESCECERSVIPLLRGEESVGLSEILN